MKFAKTSLALALASVAALTSTAAVSEDQTKGWYGGFNIGQSRATIDDERIIAELLNSGLSTTSLTNDDRDTGFKIFGAYQFNKNIAIEGGYFDLGEFGYSAVTSPPGTLAATMKARGLNVDVVGILPLTEKLSAFGRAGVNYADVKDSFSGSGAVTVLAPSPSEKGASYKMGLGLQYDFTRSIGVRAEAERYRLDDAIGNMSDIDLVSLGLVFRFGGNDKNQEESSADTATTTAPQKPAPVVVVVPVARKTSQYCSILDLNFEIDEGETQANDKEKLGVVGTFMKKYPDTTAVIEGHSDDIGTDQYNLELSQQRADSTVKYLTENFKIAPSRLSAVGYGKMRPIADNSTPEGQRANRRINAVIACAQDIEGLTVAPARTTMALEMDFDPYSAEIDPAYRDQLRSIAKFIKENPSVNASVEGHAGKYVGNTSVTAEEAMTISKRRAESVVNHLVDKLGVPRSRLSAEGYGQTRRVTYGTTLEDQQENRRVNIILTYKK
ncbi:MAG: OmpA family protein [Moraxellaceae bacterium]